MQIENRSEFVDFLKRFGYSDEYIRDICSNVNRSAETLNTDFLLDDIVKDQTLYNFLTKLEALNPKQFPRWKKSLRHYQRFAFEQASPPDYLKDEIEQKIQEIEQQEMDEAREWQASSEGESDEVLENWATAENLVLQFERAKGNNAKLVTSKNAYNELGYDIESIAPDGEIKHIEVKSSKKKIKWKQLTSNETAVFLQDPHFYLYLVEGDCVNKPSDVVVAEISREQLLKMVIMKMEARFSSLSTFVRNKIQ